MKKTKKITRLIFEGDMKHNLRRVHLTPHAMRALFMGIVLVCAFANPLVVAAGNGLTASFDWSMPDRYGLDTDGDGIIDPFTEPSQISPATWHVDLDACASSGPNSIQAYQWSVDGVVVGQSPVCDFSIDVPVEGIYRVSLTVMDTGGYRASFTQHVVVQDWLILGLGDSYGSGEGNPEGPIPDTAYTAFALAQAEVNRAISDLSAAVAALKAGQDNLKNAVTELNAAVNDLRDAELDLQALKDTLNPHFVQLKVVSDKQAAYMSAVADRDRICGARPLSIDCVNAQLAVTAAKGAWDAEIAIQVAMWLADFATSLPSNVLQALNDMLANQQAVVEAAIAVKNAKEAAVATAQAAKNTAQTARDIAQNLLDAARDLWQLRAEALTATWTDERCNRSSLSGQAQAALKIEQDDPRTSVTFVHLACSGATILEGLIGGYEGQNPPSGAPDLRPQVEQAESLAGGREVDALIVSIGGNDIGFADLIEICIVEEPCFDPQPNMGIGAVASAICSPLAIGPPPVDGIYPINHPFPKCLAYFDDLLKDTGRNAQQEFTAALATLPGLYTQLNDQIEQWLPTLLKPKYVYLTQYPNATRNQFGYCGWSPPPADQLTEIPGVTQVEMQWADEVVQTQLSNSMEASAADHGWTFVSSTYDAFTTHGYCAADNWLVRLDQTFLIQGNVSGAVHPNVAGHFFGYRPKIADALQNDFYLNGDLACPRAPGDRVSVVSRSCISNKIQEIVDNNPSKPPADKLEDAFDKLQTALDASNKTPPDNQAALGNLKGAVRDLEAAVKDGLLEEELGTQLRDLIAAIARQIAADAIQQATTQGGDFGEIYDAQQSLAYGDALRELGNFKDAVAKYKDALAKAESAMS